MNSVAASEVSVGISSLPRRDLGLDLIVAGQVLERGRSPRSGGVSVWRLSNTISTLVAEQHAAGLLHRDHAIPVVIADVRVHRGTLDVSSSDGADQAHAACIPPPPQPAETPKTFTGVLRHAPGQELVVGTPVGSTRAYFAFSESRPFWNRPACERSARARVSNHSAISSKPSSRAVFAKPGYICVYS